MVHPFSTIDKWVSLDHLEEPNYLGNKNSGILLIGNVFIVFCSRKPVKIEFLSTVNHYFSTRFQGMCTYKQNVIEEHFKLCFGHKL